jgi:hypothetical protein
MNFRDWYDGARPKFYDDPAKRDAVNAEWHRVLKKANTTANTLAYYRSSGRLIGVGLGRRLEKATADSGRPFLLSDEYARPKK